jgi:2-methylcitrate dehydratase PrpD
MADARWHSKTSRSDDVSAAGVLASYVTKSRLADIPAEVRQEGRRALLNFVGCALGAATEPAVDIAIRALTPFAGAATASIVGRGERLDPLRASLINGISSHLHDFDDTTPGTYSHTTSPVAAALFGHAGAADVAGDDLLHAFILGFEVASRVANAISPAHYEKGWHITATVGVIGAAVAVGRLRGLGHGPLVHAIGLAATQASGFREMFGSMSKAFHPGRAAESGYLAVILAEQGFTSGALSLEGPRGYMNVLSSKHDALRLVEKLGTHFFLRENTYKPYACGLVIHPTIDACSQIRQEPGFRLDDIASVSLQVSPIVFDLCNKKDIATGLESKFSVYHAAAVGLVRGKGGLREFDNAAVADSQLSKTRALVSATTDPTLDDEAVIVEVRYTNGRKMRKQVDHPIGSLPRPLTDKMLEEKFRDQAAALLPARAVNDLIAMIWNLDNVRTSDIMRATTPR